MDYYIGSYFYHIYMKEILARVSRDRAPRRTFKSSKAIAARLREEMQQVGTRWDQRAAVARAGERLVLSQARPIFWPDRSPD
jgi:hypothetical protein